MNAPRTNASAWGEAGRSAGKTFAQIAETTRKYSPKAGEMEKLGLKARSATKIAAIQAEAAVRKAEVGADALLKKTDIKIDTAKSKRKAGMIAAAGQLIGLGLAKDEEIRPTKKAIDYSATEKYFADQAARDDKAEAELRARMAGKGKPAADSTPATDKSETVQDLARRDTSTKGEGGLKLMNYLVKQKGMPKVTAAAIAGNAAHESGNFKFHEELAPNAYGTKGVGMFQWTNAGGSNRRTEFEQYAASQNLNPKSFEASAGYIDAEMKGGRHWTGGMNLDKFKGITDLNTAVTTLQDTYLRPAKATAGTGQRINYANQFLQQYNNQ